MVSKPHGPASTAPAPASPFPLPPLNAVGTHLARFFHLGSTERLRYWAGTLGRFSAMQLVLQFIGAVTGLLLVRHLTKADYALYTIANTMQGTMGILADSGVSVALSAIGGKIWQDHRRMGELINTALRIRLRLATVVGVAIAPLLGWMLWRNGATAPYNAALIVVVIVGLFFQLSGDVFIIVPRLHSQAERLQYSNLLASGLRLAVTAALLAIFLNALLAVVLATLCAALQSWQIAGWARENAPADAPVNADDQKEIARKIRHLLPNAIFYCLQGQLLILLISFTGRRDHVADVGALGRLAIIFDVFGSILVNLALPAFSRCHDPAVLKRRYLQIFGGYVLLGTTLTAVAALFPGPLLWVLGKQYAGLRFELMLLVANISVGTLAGTMWSMNAARGWVHYQWVEIPIRLALQAALLLLIDTSTVSGAISFMMLSQLSPMLFNVGLTFVGFRALRRDTVAAVPA